MLPPVVWILILALLDDTSEARTFLRLATGAIITSTAKTPNTMAKISQLALSYTRYLNAHVAVGLRETAGLYSNTYSVLNSTPVDEIGLGSTSLPVNPGTEAFDDRTYYTSTEGTFVWRKTARLSFNFGGSYFTVNRQSFSLSNVRGYQARK